MAELIRCCKKQSPDSESLVKEHGVNDKTYYYLQKQVCNALPGKLTRLYSLQK